MDRWERDQKTIEMLEHIIANKHKRSEEEEIEYRNKILDMYKDNNE